MSSQSIRLEQVAFMLVTICAGVLFSMQRIANQFPYDAYLGPVWGWLTGSIRAPQNLTSWIFDHALNQTSHMDLY